MGKPQFELSEYQKKIMSFFVTHPHDNIRIEALAGVGKSYILQLMTEKTTTSDVYLAFNNAIAQEFRGKVTNPKTKVYTTYSLGLGIMNFNLKEQGTPIKKGGSFGQKRDLENKFNHDGEAQLDQLKIHKIVDDMITDAYSRNFNWDERNYLKNNYVQLYQLARVTDIDMDDRDAVLDIINNHGLFYSPEESFQAPPDDVIVEWLKEIDNISLQQFEEEHAIDFVDMLYITVNKLKSRQWKVAYYQLFTNIYIDECQDLNKLQYQLTKYIKRPGGRYVTVGDRNQSCYLFNGADANAFDLTATFFGKTTTFELPINYRCPKSHLKLVNDLYDIPIQARPGAPEGEILHIEKNEVIDYVKPGDMIISRKNKWFAPLLIQLASNGIPVYIEDKEMVKNIEKMIKSQKVVGCTGLKHKFDEIIRDFESKIHDIISLVTGGDNKEDTQKKIEDTGISTDSSITEASVMVSSINTKLDNLHFISTLLDSFMKKKKNAGVDEFLNYIHKILNTTPSKDCVRISSVHRAKGLEAPNVFVLNEARVCKELSTTPEQRQQEINLSYISITRAMDTLYLVSEDDDV